MTKKQKEREERYKYLLAWRLGHIERLAEINREIKTIEAERAYENKLVWKLKTLLF